MFQIIKSGLFSGPDIKILKKNANFTGDLRAEFLQQLRTFYSAEFWPPRLAELSK
jgi:hypothetical protein